MPGVNRAFPRRAFLLSALVLSAGGAAGCSSKERAEATQVAPDRGAPAPTPAPTPAAEPPKGPAMVTIAREQQATWVRNFNPLLPEGNSRFPTVAGIYEPLLIYNTMRNEYTPWLATKYAWSEGNKKLTFTIRSGVKWSDGHPFTARDVSFTFALLRKHPALDLSGIWKFLGGVTAESENVVEFTLKRPYVPGLSYIGHQPIVPEHKWKDIADPVTYPNENPVATGPFTEVKTFQNQVYELGKNPNYWQEGKPAVEGLRFPAYPGNDQVMLALINGEVDWAGAFVPNIERVFVEKDPANHHYWFPLVGGTATLYPNSTKKPFDDVRVRKAISMAIDREQIVKIAADNYTHSADATGLDDSYERFRNEKAVEAGDWVRLDVQRANQILDEAGYPRAADGLRTRNGKPLRFEINVVSGWSDWVRAVQIITQNLQSVGIDASMRTYDFSAFHEALQKGTFDMSMGWTTVEPTPYNFYRDLMSAELVKPVGEMSARNWHRFGAKEADTLFHAFEAATGPADQKRILDALQMIFVQTAPVIPLFVNPSWGEYSTKRFTGFPTLRNPYAKLTPNNPPEYLLVLVELRPR
ncbi:ABC transporter substrate-binding protein [Sorangium cellulosum]|uniref:Peptide ABC transporter substrate-binding protein n=1 Tax=Sorangium cellulosum TaxID=56 RepID=A0A150PYA0_SORCE|nr:ABC transporter substrate-binding protein [Sorangium cellulosum]KYF60513.1 peptide ABC transporter substrate-binding protein [Sorangium cellulosum]